MCASNAEVDDLEVRHPTLYTVDRASGALGRPIAVDGPAVPMGVAEGSLVLLQEHKEGTELTGYDGLARVDPASRKVTYSRLAKTYGGTPGMANGTLYMSGQTGLMTALDPATGRKKWSRQTSVEGASGPVAGSGALYFSSATGRVVALSPRDGTTLWTTDPQADGLTGEQGASPRVTLAGRAVIVAADGNILFAFDAQKPPGPTDRPDTARPGPGPGPAVGPARSAVVPNRPTAVEKCGVWVLGIDRAPHETQARPC